MVKGLSVITFRGVCEELNWLILYIDWGWVFKSMMTESGVSDFKSC